MDRRSLLFTEVDPAKGTPLRTNRGWVGGAALTAIMLVCGVLAGGLVQWNRYLAASVVAPLEVEEWREEPPLGDPEPGAPIKMFFDGIQQPQYNPAARAGLAAADQVLGIVLEGEPMAFPVKSMSMPEDLRIPQELHEARRHVVNDILGDTAFSVTYCCINQSARVLVQDGRNEALKLAVGGYFDGRMLLVLDGRQYAQLSEHIPLDDAPYEITTWGDWKSRYPTTVVYAAAPSQK